MSVSRRLFRHLPTFPLWAQGASLGMKSTLSGYRSHLCPALLSTPPGQGTPAASVTRRVSIGRRGTLALEPWGTCLYSPTVELQGCHQMVTRSSWRDAGGKYWDLADVIESNPQSTMFRAQPATPFPVEGRAAEDEDPQVIPFHELLE